MAKRRTESGREILKQVNILADLTDEELDTVYRISKKVEVSAGHVIMTEGEVGDSMFFFVEGEVDVSKLLTMKIGKQGFGSAEKSMVKLNSKAVSFFGDMAMFQNAPRNATITASTECILYEVKRDDFIRLVDEHPVPGVKILKRIASTLCGRVAKGNEDVLKLTTALSIALTR